MKICRGLLTLTCLLGSSIYASHYLGGDLVYECLGPDPNNPAQTLYRITVTIYRDCNGIEMAPITVSWRSIQCGVNNSTIIDLPFPGSPGAGTDVTPVCSSQPSACPNGGFGLYGIQKWVYETIIALPTGCGQDWVIWHGNCCRSESIDNLVDPGGQGTVLYATLDNTVTPCNSSPRFTNLPQFFNCVNSPTLLNLGVIDPDGDSLAISLTNCLTDATPQPPFSQTDYIPGRSGLNPFPTITGISIQPQGIFSYIVSQLYRAVFCYKVEEFRNGVKIGETFQDVYLVVLSCPSNSTVATTTAPGRPPIRYDPADANSFIFTAPICPGETPQPYCITFTYRDTVNPPPQNNLRVTPVLTPPGATITVVGNNTSNARVQMCWAPTLADVGDYSVIFTVENNACPVRGRADYTYLLRVRPGLSWQGGIAVIRGPGDTILTRDTIVCFGTSLQLYLTVRDSVPNPADIASISWSTTGGLTPPPSFPPPPQSAATRPVVTVTGNGEYIALVTFRGGCTDRDTLRVRVFPRDTVRIQEPVKGCTGGTITLSATSTSNLPIEWYTGAPLTGTFLGTGNVISYTIPPNASSPLPIYALTRDPNGCIIVDTAFAILRPGPTISTQVNRATCLGINNGSITITPSPAGTYTYSLYNAGGVLVAGPQATGTFTGLAPGQYILLVQGPDPAEPCEVRDTLAVGQGDSVGVRFVGDSILYGCAPFSVQLEVQTAAPPNTSLTYSWDLGDGTVRTTSTPTLSHTFSSSNRFTVVIRVSTPNGCYALDTLIVDTRNAIGVEARAPAVCKGSASAGVIVSVAASAVPPVSYQAVPLQPGAGPTFGPQNDSVFTGIPLGVPYEFIAQDARNCQGRDTLTLIVTDSVEALSLTAGEIANCSPVAVPFRASARGSGTLTYIWDFGNGGTVTTTTPSATGIYQDAGTYVVRLIVRNEAGCADTLLLPIEIPATGERITAQLLSFAPAELRGCVPFTVSLSATGSSSLGNPLTYRWDLGDGTVIRDTQVTHTYTRPGRYEAVFYAQSSPQCYDTIRVIIVVDSLPSAQIIPPTGTRGYFIGSPLTFTAAAGPYNQSFFWRADSQASGSGRTYTISYFQRGTYCVYLTVLSELGCTDSTSYCFDVEGYALFVPNAFTPNADGINDRLIITAYGMEYVEFLLYDRWGVLIYSARGSEQISWDGTRNGSPVPEGVYTYVVRYKPIDKPQAEFRAGTITLLR
ncbi:MAG: PKD domain-containing protein [Bacteroidia bacterium]|nr:PKD domain-containing protein [Bacteroidia bacterium]